MKLFFLILFLIPEFFILGCNDSTYEERLLNRKESCEKLGGKFISFPEKIWPHYTLHQCVGNGINTPAY